MAYTPDKSVERIKMLSVLGVVPAFLFVSMLGEGAAEEVQQRAVIWEIEAAIWLWEQTVYNLQWILDKL